MVSPTRRLVHPALPPSDRRAGIGPMSGSAWVQPDPGSALEGGNVGQILRRTAGRIVAKQVSQADEGDGHINEREFDPPRVSSPPPMLALPKNFNGRNSLGRGRKSSLTALSSGCHLHQPVSKMNGR